MKCQNCGEREANVRYTQIINGVKKEMALCEECSRKIGLENFDFSIPINISSFLGDFLEDSDEFFPSYINSKQLKCPECGMTYDEFTHLGKFGCSKCVETFEDKLDTILQNVQGTCRHNGKKYKLLGQAIPEDMISKGKEENEKKEKIEKLKEDLKQAVEEERYEDAAKIRDEIKEKEKEE